MVQSHIVRVCMLASNGFAVVWFVGNFFDVIFFAFFVVLHCFARHGKVPSNILGL